MEVARIQVRSIRRQNLSQEQEIFVDTVNNCPLCGTDLKFSHQTDLLTGTVKESAQCASCGINTRTQSFKIQ